jgi:hypothetical protein
MVRLIRPLVFLIMNRFFRENIRCRPMSVQLSVDLILLSAITQREDFRSAQSDSWHSFKEHTQTCDLQHLVRTRIDQQDIYRKLSVFYTARTIGMTS